MKRFIGLGWVLVLGLMIVGCGVKTDTTRYYYSPSWVRDGKIIMLGYLKSTDKDVLGSQLGSTASEYALTIYPTGTDESSALFDTTEEMAYAMSCSPTTDYVAYMTDLRLGLYRKIVIRNIASGAHTGLEVVELSFSPGIKSFDWANNGTSLVYCTTQEVRTVDVDGSNDSLVVADSNIEFVAWQTGGRIAFVHESGGNKILSLIRQNGGGRIDMSAAASVDLPQISSVNTNEVYGVAGDAYKKVNVNTSAVSDIVASGFEGALPRLSPDASMITYSKTDEVTGVYTLLVSNEVETKVK